MSPQRRGRRDAGFVTFFTVGVFAVMSLMLGLVIEAGQVFRYRSEAFGTAGAAARAGAQELDEHVGVQEGRAVIDQNLATQAVNEYVSDRHSGMTIENISFPADNQITVTISASTDLNLLPGSVSFQLSSTVRAHQGGPGLPDTGS